MTDITLDAARAVIQGALAKGRELNLKPLAVAVVDTGGHIKAFEREDGATFLRFEVAVGKAYGAAGLGVNSQVLDTMTRERMHFGFGLVGISGGQVMPIQGAVVIKDADGTLLGAVGITGDTSANDEAAAVAGVEAAGLVAVTG